MRGLTTSQGRGSRLTAVPPVSALRLSILSILLLSVPGPALLAEPRDGGRVSDAVGARARTAGASDLLPVIVQTHGATSDSHLLKMLGKGGKLKGRHNSVDGYSASMTAALLQELADDPDVERISMDSPVRAFLDVALQAVRAGTVTTGFGGLDGSGIGIAMIDTGVQGHSDLLRSKGEGALEVEIVGHEKGLADYFGHGTHVAGILAGNGLLSSGPESFRTFRGVAPMARLISLRALNADGTGSASDVLAAVDWVLSHRHQYNIRVLNLSLGHPIDESYTTDPLCRAARRAVDAGIVVVAAAGNGGRAGSGFGTIVSPANEPSVITVGAMDHGGTVAREDDVLAPYSAKGPTLVDQLVKPDLVAPGSFIVSLRAVGSTLDVQHHETVLSQGEYSTVSPREADGAYMRLSGTSLSAPMVAGAAALMLQQDPGLSPADVKARLMITATKDNLMPFETGAGYLDVAAALLSTVHADSALSPRAVADATGGVAVLPLEGTWSEVWKQGLVWGGGRSFGMLADTENDAVTASGLVWGGGTSRFLGGLDATLDDMVEAAGIIWGGGI